MINLVFMFYGLAVGFVMGIGFTAYILKEKQEGGEWWVKENGKRKDVVDVVQK